MGIFFFHLEEGLSQLSTLLSHSPADVPELRADEFQEVHASSALTKNGHSQKCLGVFFNIVSQYNEALRHGCMGEFAVNIKNMLNSNFSLWSSDTARLSTYWQIYTVMRMIA